MTREEALRGRQRALLETLPKHVLVIAAGQSRLRNITSLAYPFRPASSFLYFFGKMPPGTIAVLAEGSSTVFIEEPAKDDVLWHGPKPSFEQYRAACCADQVKSKSELITFISKFDQTDILALPTLDPVTNGELRLVLDRTVRRDGRDSTLINVIISMRLYHDAFSLAQVREACEITSRAFERGIAALEPGANERKVRAEMEYAVGEAGTDLAFDPIVTTCGEVLHQTRCGADMSAGEMLLVDFGAESSEGYASDVSRTWPVSGKFTGPQKDLYQLVLHVQKTAFALAKPGIEFKELHQVACETICQGLIDLGIFTGDPQELARRGAHTLFFPHGLGHLLGLDVHDMEDFGDAAGYAQGRARSEEFGYSALRLDRVLERDMIITLEPGLYMIPALLKDSQRTEPLADCLNLEKANDFLEVRGIRIEDTVLITEEASESLTASIPKEISEIEALVSA